MSTQLARYHPINIAGLGWGFSAALVVLFVLCLLVGLFFPLRVAHGWVELFSIAPINSARVWAEGIAYSFVAGWIAAIILGVVYNRISAR